MRTKGRDEHSTHLSSRYLMSCERVALKRRYAVNVGHIKPLSFKLLNLTKTFIHLVGQPQTSTMEKDERSTSGLLCLPFSFSPGEIIGDRGEIRCGRKPTIIFTPSYSLMGLGAYSLQQLGSVVFEFERTG